jgi:GcrA cell cycle regulator
VKKTPLDLSFEDLVAAGENAAAAAAAQAREAGVRIPMLSGGSASNTAAEAREAAVKRLWEEGLSASQIAKQIGGVSRNWVIGRVHRLGLSGRPTRVRPSRPIPVAELMAANAPPIRYVDEGPGTATVLTLGAHMCKWPIGDPAHDNFTFCGRRTVDDGPYCAEHWEMAYGQAPSAEKSRRQKRPTDKALVIQIRSITGA